MSMITKDSVTKRLPAIITVNGCDTLVSTVAQAAKFGWSAVVAEEVVTPPLPDEEYNKQQDAARKWAFVQEADPIYLNEIEWAIHENRDPDLTLWLAKKAEIRERFPYRA